MILATKATVAGSAGQKLPYLWVGVGADGNLWTSNLTNASSWTQRTSSFGTNRINNVEADGSTLYVAVGQVGTLATSPDGFTWTQRTSSFGTSEIRGIAYHGGLWVAVGSAGKIATSTDGVTWTQQTANVGTAALYTVWRGDGVWVAAASTGAITTSPDGVTWTSRTGANTTAYTGDYFSSADLHVLVGDSSNNYQTSPDGTTWTSRAFSVGSYGNFGNVLATENLVAHFSANSSLVPQMRTSTNGTSWTLRTLGTTTTVGTAQAFAYDNDGNFVAGSSKTPIASIWNWYIDTSSNGTSWSQTANFNTSGLLFAVCHSSGRSTT
jgi:hypothetical protein